MTSSGPNSNTYAGTLARACCMDMEDPPKELRPVVGWRHKPASSIEAECTEGPQCGNEPDAVAEPRTMEAPGGGPAPSESEERLQPKLQSSGPLNHGTEYGPRWALAEQIRTMRGSGRPLSAAESSFF